MNICKNFIDIKMNIKNIFMSLCVFLGKVMNFGVSWISVLGVSLSQAGVADLEEFQAGSPSLLYHYTFEGANRVERLAQKKDPFRPELSEYTNPGRFVDPVTFPSGLNGHGFAVRTSAGGLALGQRKTGSALESRLTLTFPQSGTIEFLIRPGLIDDQGCGIAGEDGETRWRFFQNGGVDSGIAVSTIGDNVPLTLIGEGTAVPYVAGHWYYVIQSWSVRDGRVVLNAWVADLNALSPRIVQTISEARHGHAGGFDSRLRIGSLNDSLAYFRGDIDALAVYNIPFGPSDIEKRLEILGIGASPSITGLSAVCRDGQVFIKWSEPPLNRGNLSVYMHDEPIHSENLGKAVLLESRIEPKSANDWFEDPSLCPRTNGPARGWIIDKNCAPLDPVGGLFVHTVQAEDPATAFFAVLAEGQDEEDLVAGENTTLQGTPLAKGEIQPIWQMGEPDPRRKKAAGKPLALVLHAHTGRPEGSLNYLIFGDKTMGWREGLPFKFKVSVLEDIVVVEPYDRVWINRYLEPGETYEAYNRKYKNIETWHYGTNDRIDDPEQRANGIAVNYTERLYLRILDWVQEHYGTDPNKVYGYGTSMGTGIQRLALQNPDRFASVDLMVPFVDWSYVDGDKSNAKRFEASCGPMSMMTNEGVTLGERMNLVDFVGKTRRNLPHITIRAGRGDRSVYWERKPPYLAAMQANRHGITAAWDLGGHGDAMRYSVEGLPDFQDYRYAIERFALNKSFPAFSNFSLDDEPGDGRVEDGDPVGFINRGIDWSNVIDRRERYEVHITVSHPAAMYPETVDVTPRNLQNFRPSPGQLVRMVNINADGRVTEEKDATVGAGGLITYENFAIDSSGGNTLQMVLPEL